MVDISSIPRNGGAGSAKVTLDSNGKELKTTDAVDAELTPAEAKFLKEHRD